MIGGDKVVVITGASAGIGRATAVEFARHGCRIALLARGYEGLAAAAREVEAAGGHPLVIPTDVAVPDQVEAAAERVENELGPIDIRINSAMVTVFSPVSEMRPHEYRRVTEVTYLGTVHGTQAALRRMLPRDSGTIVQVGSALAHRAIPLQSAYCGAKFAIRGFTDSLRSELIHDRSAVRLTMVQLAAFNTPQFDWARVHGERQPQPLPPIFQPEEAARGIVHAAFHPRRELWVGWPAVKAILAGRIAPALLDRMLAKQAYDGQFTDEPIAPNRPDNLFEPLPGTRGMHGRFNARAANHSRQLTLTIHKGPVAAAVTAALIAIVAVTVWAL